MFLRPDKCVYMLHIELGFLLHDFIQDILWGFVSKYRIEQSIFIQHEIEWVAALFECGLLEWIGVGWLRRFSTELSNVQEMFCYVLHQSASLFPLLFR